MTTHDQAGVPSTGLQRSSTAIAAIAAALLMAGALVFLLKSDS